MRVKEVAMRALVLRRAVYILGSCVLVAGVWATLAAPASVTVRVSANRALGGRIVVDASGFTLYHFMTEGKGSIRCTGACRKVWPPLLVAGGSKPVAGPGLAASKLATVKRPDGGVQVTYDGFGLYRYSGDTKAGDVNGQGLERSWYALTPAGTITKAAASAGAPAETTTTQTTTPATTTAGGGYNY
jgi:predicted lipoprotein with Yx(FWY)xxD motif